MLGGPENFAPKKFVPNIKSPVHVAPACAVSGEGPDHLNLCQIWKKNPNWNGMIFLEYFPLKMVRYHTAHNGKNIISSHLSK